MIKKISAIFILCLLAAFATENLISLQSNTLASHQSWYSLKKLSNSYFLGFMGADDFLFERQSTAGQKLNLGAWFGYQDVLYKKPLPDFTNYAVNFNLETEKSYLWAYLNCDNEKCWALRLSANAEYPTGMYLIMNSGEFVKNEPIELKLAEGDHKLNISKKGDFYEIKIDDSLLKKFEYAFEYKPIRFAGSYANTSISKIEFTDVAQKNSAIDFKASFNNKRFIVITLVLLILNFLLLALIRKNNNKWNLSLTSSLVAFLLAILFYGFDQLYWSHLYLSERPNPTQEVSAQWLSKIEKLRNRIFVSEYDLFAQNNFLKQHIWFKPFQELQQKDMGIGINDFQIIDANGNTTFKKDITADIESINQKNYLKVAIIGGSQAWGTGATRLNKTWGALVVKDLALKTNRTVVGINFSICGGVLYNFIERAELIKKFKPDLFIFSFGANDIATPDPYFNFQLKEFSQKINFTEVNTLFSIEALSHEASNEETTKAPFIRRFAENNQLKIVSLHDYFKSPAVVDSGNMWHDQVHFTDFGHIQASRFFTNTQAYKDLLASLKKSTSN